MSANRMRAESAIRRAVARLSGQPVTTIDDGRGGTSASHWPAEGDPFGEGAMTYPTWQTWDGFADEE